MNKLITEQESKICKICNQEFNTSKLKIYHVLNVHGLNFEQYILSVYYNDQYPTCKCGCNTKLSFKSHKLGPWFSEYTKNHWPHKKHTTETKLKIKETFKKTMLSKYGVENPMLIKEFRDKIKHTKLKRYGDENYNNQSKNIQTLFKNHGVLNRRYLVKRTKSSKIEKEIAQKIGAKHKFKVKNKEFDMIFGNDIFEIDGDFWHPRKLENLTISQISSALNDKIKMDIVSNSKFNLFKILISNLPNDITVENLKKVSDVPDFSLTYHQTILTKEYFDKVIKRKGKEILREYAILLLRFIRTFQPTFPELPQEETLEEVVDKLSMYDVTKLIDVEKRVFKNNCSNVGVNYLKSNFKSYWKSKFNNNLTPIEAWYDDAILKKIIEYQIGYNNSGEIFDFSLYRLIRGISYNRYTISFFKPMLAAAIYKYFLKNIESPVVIDPCAGFGGRMLGFKSMFPNGTYIGIEPNPETFKELKSLSNKFNNIQLYNCKLEEFDVSINKYDLVFTSIPYFNKEIYSNSVDYDSILDWENTFIAKLKSFNNLLINVPFELKFLFPTYDSEYFISNNRSHFSKRGGTKYDSLLRMNTVQ